MTAVMSRPILSGVKALPHTPIYRMHRYFARRPHNVINTLIDYYSKPGDIVLDPFCGGGTTLVESLRLQRRVIGIDINPMATYITRCEIMNIAPEEVETALERIAEVTREEINVLYQTPCPCCEAEAITNWVKWSVIYICPHCNHPTVVAEAKKLGPGRYTCTHCSQVFQVTGLPREADKMLELHLSCPICGYVGMKQATEQDATQLIEVVQQFDSLVEEEGLWYPQKIMPFDYELRKPNNMICERFSDLFSRRNLLALARLLRRINDIEDRETRYFLQHVFTSVVSWTNRMVTDERHGWALHAYWLPDVYCENNVWNILRRRSKWAVRGKKYSQKHIGDYWVEAKSADDILHGDATCWLLTQSSTSLPLPDKSVDVVVTDPPYGGNVQYGELCSFWATWLPETLVGLPEDQEEVVMKRYREGEAEKFENLLARIFSECHRVLKDDAWLVITFNNRDTNVWFSMLRAARQAGFCLARDGITYQAPITDYARTLHQMKDGAVKGDFILSFCKSSSSVAQDCQWQPGDLEKHVIGLVADTLKDGPATFSQVYKEIVPMLVTQNILGEEMQSLNLERLLFENFAFEELPVEKATDWPLKKTTVQKWTLPPTQDEKRPSDA